MTSISYLHGSSNETDVSRLCRKKARDCQRTALTAEDPTIRQRFLHLAKLWREMADEAEQKAEGASEAKGVVIFFPTRSQMIGKVSAKKAQ
jgi:hypothetical protein